MSLLVTLIKANNYVQSHLPEDVNKFSESSGTIMDLSVSDSRGRRCYLFWKIAGNKQCTRIEICTGSPQDENAAIVFTKPFEESEEDAIWIIESACEWIKSKMNAQIKYAMRSGDTPNIKINIGNTGRVLDFSLDEDDDDEND